MTYVDGFVLAVRRDRLADYEAMARLGSQVWIEHGALSYVECQGDDVPPGEVTSFPMAVQAGPDDVVFFSWATYESKEARDATMAKVLADPRMDSDPEKSPFNMKTMIFGGFRPLVEAKR